MPLIYKLETDSQNPDFIKIAKDFKITKSSSFTYYRGGSVVNCIYKEFGRFRKVSGISGDDKWNPADIWIAKKNFKFKSD